MPMEVESDNSRRDRRPYSRWEIIEQSNCRLVFAIVVGLVALLVDLMVQAMTGALEHSFLAGFWRVVSPWLSGCSTVVFLICAAVAAWNLYLVKLAHDEKVLKARLLEESHTQSRQTTLLLKDARVNNDNVKITYGDDEKIKSIEVIRAHVLLEQSRIQYANRVVSAGRSAQPQLDQPGRPGQAPAIVQSKPQIVIPGPYDLIDAVRRAGLAPDHMFLGVNGYRQVVSCNPSEELCHGAFNASSGRGKTILERGMETQLLKMNFEVVHADIKFSLVDEKGHDYKPIARALLAQGDMQVGRMRLPHLLIREDQIVYFLEWLAGPEMLRRLRLYNLGQHDYTVFFLFLEELLYLIGRYKHLGPLLSPLLSVGRSLGIKIFCAAQNFQVQNLKINSGMRENFESAWFLGGDMTSAAGLLDISVKALNDLIMENNIRLGKGVSIFRNNNVAYDANVLRSGMASNDFVYWMLGRADGLTLPDEILPAAGAGPFEPLDESLGPVSSFGSSVVDTEGLPMDEDVREAIEAIRMGARGPRALHRAVGGTYYRARQLWEEYGKGLVSEEEESN